MNIKKNAIKKWGHRTCLRFSRLLKWSILLVARVKNSNHLHTKLSLGYLNDTKFYRKSKAFFIHISSIASLSRFLLSGGGNIALFRTVPWFALSPRLGQNTPSTELFSQKNHVLPSNFFSSSNMLFVRLFLANT